MENSHLIVHNVLTDEENGGYRVKSYILTECEHKLLKIYGALTLLCNRRKSHKTFQYTKLRQTYTTKKNFRISKN